MWPEMFDWIIQTLAVTCCGVAIKLSDDWLDREIDFELQVCNWSTILGNGTMLYAMLFLTLAASLYTQVCLALFLMSYGVGMFHDFHNYFPLGLTGWQETLIISIMSILLFGWQLTLFAALFVFAVQLLDDFVDFSVDGRYGQRNLAWRVGRYECLILAVICMIVSWRLYAEIFLPVLLGTLLVWGLNDRLVMIARKYG